jgi:hypothetical protein
MIGKIQPEERTTAAGIDQDPEEEDALKERR